MSSLALSLILFLVGSGSGSRDWITKPVGTTGITVEVPSNWNHRAEVTDKLLLTESELRAGAVSSVLSVTAMEGLVPLEEWVPYHREKSIEEKYPRCRILNEEDRKAGAFDAHVFHVFLGNPCGGSPQAELLDCLVHTGDTVLCVALTFDRRRREAHAALLDHLLDSVRRDPSVVRKIRWRGDFGKAFEEASMRGVPVMVAFHMDGDRACEQMLHSQYVHPGVTALAEKMVCLVASNYRHIASSHDPCPLFPGVTCREHREVYREAMERFIEVDPETGRFVVNFPQHIFCRPDGSVIRRREFFISASDLAREMKQALEEVHSNESGPAKSPGPDLSAGPPSRKT